MYEVSLTPLLTPSEKRCKPAVLHAQEVAIFIGSGSEVSCRFSRPHENASTVSGLHNEDCGAAEQGRDVSGKPSANSM